MPADRPRSLAWPRSSDELHVIAVPCELAASYPDVTSLTAGLVMAATAEQEVGFEQIPAAVRFGRGRHLQLRYRALARQARLAGNDPGDPRRGCHF